MPTPNMANATPAAPAGAQNVTWQFDGSGNISAYVTAAWQTWTPSLSADAGTFALNNLYLAQYCQQGPTVLFEMRFAATTNNASAAFLTLSLPTTVVAANNFAVTPAALVEACPAGMTTWTLVPTRVQVPNSVVMQLPALSRWPAGAYTIAISGFYRTI